jgi:hypothetical protein
MLPEDRAALRNLVVVVVASTGALTALGTILAGRALPAATSRHAGTADTHSEPRLTLGAPEPPHSATYLSAAQLDRGPTPDMAIEAGTSASAPVAIPPPPPAQTVYFSGPTLLPSRNGSDPSATGADAAPSQPSPYRVPIAPIAVPGADDASARPPNDASTR